MNYLEKKILNIDLIQLRKQHPKYIGKNCNLNLHYLKKFVFLTIHQIYYQNNPRCFLVA